MSTLPRSSLCSMGPDLCEQLGQLVTQINSDQVGSCLANCCAVPVYWPAGQ